MTEGTLYNGKQFPDYIFTAKVTHYLFFEFDLLFEEEFWLPFKKYLESNNVEKIVIENLQPDYSFSDEIKVKELPESFMQSARTEKLEGYFSFKTSLYMMTQKALIFSRENKELFCILLDRDYSLSIIGFSNSKHPDLDNELTIKNVADYLTMSFAGKDLPIGFKDSLYKNWKLPL